jgi:UDP-glucuronate decarboxylase
MQPFIQNDINNVAFRLGSAAKILEGKSILIAGGAGFLGRYWLEIFSRLNQEVLSSPCKITVLDNFITGIEDDYGVRDNFSFFEHDIINPLPHSIDCDFIVHAAGIASPQYYRAYPIETLEVSTAGTKNLLDLAKKQNAKIVYFSSSEIYGDPDPRMVPIPESYRGNVTTMGPRACYDEGKRVGETLCYIYHQNHGVDVSVIRPFNVYGPGMRENDYRVLPNFAANAIANKPLQIYGSGLQTRTYSYIEDAMCGFFLALFKGLPGEAYNIGTPTPEISVFDLADSLERALGQRVSREQIKYPDTYPGDEPQRRCPDISKAQEHLGFNPTVSLDEGLKRFIGWARENFKGVG